MIPLSVLTIVKDREAPLVNLIEGLLRSGTPPAELIVVDMSDRPLTVPETPFATTQLRLAGQGLPLAAARNLAASYASGPALLFLDVDCIPMCDCLATMTAALDRDDALLCADIRYLPESATAGDWDEPTLMRLGKRHPVRAFPEKGVRRECNYGFFWSLAFAVHKSRFDALGGFDEGYSGYGAEDTDFGFRAERAGVPLLFVGGAVACHQYHVSHDPPVAHLDDILRNARYFHRVWGVLPMQGWLEAFESMGLVRRTGEDLERVRATTMEDFARTQAPSIAPDGRAV